MIQQLAGFVCFYYEIERKMWSKTYSLFEFSIYKLKVTSF